MVTKYLFIIVNALEIKGVISKYIVRESLLYVFKEYLISENQ